MENKPINTAADSTASKSSSEVLRACTIIIPTYNRPDRLTRILGYYSDVAKGMRIIVADSSSDANKAINKASVAMSTDLRINYISDYPSNTSPVAKFADAAGRVETPYSVFCADDDFVTPAGISASIAFLEKNPDFSVAHGRFIRFCVDGFKWNHRYYFRSDVDPDPLSRVKMGFISPMFLTFYGVQRTIFMKMLYSETSRYGGGLAFSELFIFIMKSIYGKSKVLDVLYGAREHIPETLGVANREFKLMKKGGRFDAELSRFSAALAPHLSKVSGLSLKESEAFILKQADILFNRVFDRGGSRIMFRFKPALRALGVYDSIAQLYLRIFHKNSKPFDTRVFKSPDSRYYPDFCTIKRHIYGAQD